MIVQTLDGDACLLWASKELLNNADGIIRQTTKPTMKAAMGSVHFSAC